MRRRMEWRGVIVRKEIRRGRMETARNDYKTRNKRCSVEKKGKVKARKCNL
jgi:hypothetical protein